MTISKVLLSRKGEIYGKAKEADNTETNRQPPQPPSVKTGQESKRKKPGKSLYHQERDR